MFYHGMNMGAKFINKRNDVTTNVECRPISNSWLATSQSLILKTWTDNSKFWKNGN
jgi:hypothetical protein